MEKCVKKYCLKYVARNANLGSCLAVFGFFLFFIVSGNYKRADEGNFVFILLPLIFGANLFLISNLSLIGFRKTIREQEQKYGVTFNDKNAQKLYLLIYLTDEWLIDCGMTAVLRKNINEIECKQVYRRGASIKITLFTDDKSYKIYVNEQYQADKVKEWLYASKI